MRLVRQFIDIRATARVILSVFWAQKIWWMVPLLGMLGLFIFLIVFGALTGSGPFNYTLF